MNYRTRDAVALSRLFFAPLRADRTVAAMRSFPPLAPADLTRFATITTDARPIAPDTFLELTVRVTRGEIDAMLVHSDGGPWCLAWARARTCATRMARAAA